MYILYDIVEAIRVKIVPTHSCFAALTPQIIAENIRSFETLCKVFVQTLALEIRKCSKYKGSIMLPGEAALALWGCFGRLKLRWQFPLDTVNKSAL